MTNDRTDRRWSALFWWRLRPPSRPASAHHDITYHLPVFWNDQRPYHTRH